MEEARSGVTKLVFNQAAQIHRGDMQTETEFFKRLGQAGRAFKEGAEGGVGFVNGFHGLHFLKVLYANKAKHKADTVVNDGVKVKNFCFYMFSMHYLHSNQAIIA